MPTPQAPSSNLSPQLCNCELIPKTRKIRICSEMHALVKMANLVKICQSVSKNSNEMANGAMTSGNVDFWTYMYLRLVGNQIEKDLKGSPLFTDNETNKTNGTYM